MLDSLPKLSAQDSQGMCLTDSGFSEFHYLSRFLVTAVIDLPVLPMSIKNLIGNSIGKAEFPP